MKDKIYLYMNVMNIKYRLLRYNSQEKYFKYIK